MKIQNYRCNKIIANDILEMVDVLEEIKDKNVLGFIKEGRRAVRKGAKGISVAYSLRKRDEKTY